MKPRRNESGIVIRCAGFLVLLLIVPCRCAFGAAGPANDNFSSRITHKRKQIIHGARFPARRHGE